MTKKQKNEVEETDMEVAGFEFEAKVARQLRDSDTCMRVLFALQDKGVAVINKDWYVSDEAAPLRRETDNYWEEFYSDPNSRYSSGGVVLVTHDKMGAVIATP